MLLMAMQSLYFLHSSTNNKLLPLQLARNSGIRIKITSLTLQPTP